MHRMLVREEQVEYDRVIHDAEERRRLEQLLRREPTNPLGDGRPSGADHDAEAGYAAGDLLQEFPALRAEDGDVEEQRVQLHRNEIVDWDVL